MHSQPKPTFLCIGTQKAGTSWLFHMLRQHPEIFTSDPKEIHFFNREYNYRKGLAWYLRHFEGAGAFKAIGEFTPDYLWDRPHPGAEPAIEVGSQIPGRIAEVLPDIQLLVILRNPVDRAVSSYFHEIGAARLSPNCRLSKAGDHAAIISKGYYAEHLKRWFAHFPRKSFKILIYEVDLASESIASTLRSVFEHIGVDPSFAPLQVDRRYNKRRTHFDYRLSGLPGRMQGWARRFTPAPIVNSGFWKIPVSDEELHSLRAHYDAHNNALKELLGRNLPW